MILGAKPIGTVAYLGGVPAVLEEFCHGLAQLLIHSREVLCSPTQYVHLDRVKFSDHGPARNALAERMLGDWILMLDTDHEPPPDLLVRLLHRAETNGLDVVTGVYRFKSPPHLPVLFATNPDSDLLLPVVEYPRGLFRVDACGAGALLVRRSVFDRIHGELKEGPFDRYAGLSEDHSFCRRLKKLGIELWCDGRVENPHLRAAHVGEQDASDLNTSRRFPVEGIPCQP